MIDVVLTSEQSIGISLILGGCIAWIFVYFLENGFKVPNLGFKYILLEDAGKELRKEKLKRGETLVEVIDECQDIYKNSTSAQYYSEHILGDNPVWGKRKDSKVWERLDDRKNLHRLRVNKDGKSLIRDGKIIYPEARMLKSDFKKYMKLVKKKPLSLASDRSLYSVRSR